MALKIKKPNLFIIGASKCATTTLWAILKEHPQIFMSEEKEPSHFVQKDYQKKMLSYLANFEEAFDEKYIGEASPIYSETTIHPDIAKRLFDFNYEAKIIYIVREPISRIKSVWKQTLFSGHWYETVYDNNFGTDGIGMMPLSIEEAIFNYPPFVPATKYWTHLSNYREFFSDQNILLLFYEDLKKDQSSVVKQIYDFLDLSFIQFTSPKHANKSSTKKRFPFWFKKISSKTQVRIKYLLPPIIFDMLIKRQIGNVEIPIKIQQRVYENLKDEISNILEYGNKPNKFWKMGRGKS